MHTHRRPGFFLAALLLVSVSSPPGFAAPPVSKAMLAQWQALLQRPDTDVITLGNGKQVSARELKQVLTRQAQVVPLPLPQRDQLLQAPLALRAQINSNAASARLSIASATANPTAIAAAGDPSMHGPTNIRGQKSYMQSYLSLPPGVWQVNGQSQQFILTPGGALVVTGKGFGVPPVPNRLATANTLARHRVPGRMRALAPAFSAGALDLPVTAWADAEVDASVPAGLRGLLDFNGVVLELTTPDGVVFHSQPGSFIAAREEIGVPAPLTNVVQFVSSPSWPGPTMDGYGGVYRMEDMDGDFNCKPTGQDAFIFGDLPRGFVVSGIYMTVQSPTITADGDGLGNQGSRVFFPGYQIVGWDQVHQGASNKNQWRVRVNWGIWHWHRSPNIIADLRVAGGSDYDWINVLYYAEQLGLAAAWGPYGVIADAYINAVANPIVSFTSAHNGCWSQYAIGVTAIGPAGVTPW